jgi:hypothetical protein
VPSPRNTLAIGLAAAAAGGGVGLAAHNTISNHPETGTVAPFNAEVPAISFKEYLAKNALHDQVAAPATTNHSRGEAAMPASPASVDAPTYEPAAISAPSTPPMIESPKDVKKPSEKAPHASKDGENTTNDPSTRPSDFEAAPASEDDGEGGSYDGSSYGEGEEGSYGDYPDQGTPGEMTPGGKPDPTTPATTPPTPEAPENNPHLDLAQRLSDEIFSNDPGNPRQYITGKTRIFKPNRVSFNVSNAFYRLYQTETGPVLIVGYHALKGGGDEPKGSFGYESFDGVDEINTVSVFPDESGKAPIQPALSESVSLTYQSKDNPGAFVGQYGIELGVVDSGPSNATSGSHLTIKDGNIALEPLNFGGMK